MILSLAYVRPHDVRTAFQSLENDAPEELLSVLFIFLRKLSVAVQHEEEGERFLHVIL